MNTNRPLLPSGWSVQVLDTPIQERPLRFMIRTIILQIEKITEIVIAPMAREVPGWF
jgi:CheY-like chemotaxis protein